jgi:hypothetical protein
LCTHRNRSDNKAFLSNDIVAREMGGVSLKTVQRARAGLLAKNWICLPCGDAGGRGNSTITYHLHADGSPCNLPKPVLKQRAAKASKKVDRESTFNAPTKVDRGSGKVDRNDTKADCESVKVDHNGVAYKEELRTVTRYIEPLHQHQHMQAADPMDEQFPTAAVDDDDDGSQSVIKESEAKNSERANGCFSRLEVMVGGPIGISGRNRIRVAQAKHGFTLLTLEYAFRHFSPLDRGGGLIEFAEEWIFDADQLAKLPDCFVCEDTAMVMPPHRKDVSTKGVKDTSFLDATIAAGKRQMVTASAQADVTWVCECARGRELLEAHQQAKAAQSGAPDPSPTSDSSAKHESFEERQRHGEARRHEEARRRAADERAHSKERHEAELMRKGICPNCEGAKEKAGKTCVLCYGLGIYRSDAEWDALGECSKCYGTARRRVLGGQCTVCHGSGKRRAGPLKADQATHAGCVNAARG